MIEPLLVWYTARLDGEWEHRYGFTIQTADNSGLIVTLDPGREIGPDRVLETLQDGSGELINDIRVRGGTSAGFAAPDGERALIVGLLEVEQDLFHPDAGFL